MIKRQLLRLTIPVICGLMVNCCIFGLPATIFAAERNTDEFFDVSFSDLQEELAIVSEEGKAGLMIMFDLDYCPTCLRMKREILNQENVQVYFRSKFRIINVNIKGDVEVTDIDGSRWTAREFARKALEVVATPTFVFYDPEGNIVVRHRGGLATTDDFLLLGRFVAEGHYSETRFAEYLSSNHSG